jgi:hypothetical protein
VTLHVLIDDLDINLINASFNENRTLQAKPKDPANHKNPYFVLITGIRQELLVESLVFLCETDSCVENQLTLNCVMLLMSVISQSTRMRPTVASSLTPSYTAFSVRILLNSLSGGKVMCIILDRVSSISLISISSMLLFL